MTVKIKQGDWFLLPYSGTEHDRLVQAESPAPTLDPAQWVTCSATGTRSITLLSSCEPIGRDRAQRILQSRDAAPRGRSAFLILDGGESGRREYPCRVVGETLCKYRIEVDQDTRLSTRVLRPGERFLVAKTSVRFHVPHDRT